MTGYRLAFVVLPAGLALTPMIWAGMGSARREIPFLVDIASEVGLTWVNASSPSKEYIVDVNGNGTGLFDYDGDGDLDVLLVNGSTLDELRADGAAMATLYRNDGGRFVDVTEPAGMATRGWGMGTCIADYDNDGDRDAYLTALGPNILYRNDGDGTFTDVASGAGVDHRGWGTNCAFGDYDRDGQVDLYVANYVEFDADAVPGRGETDACRYMGMDVFCGPRGLKGAPDVLYRNEGDGTFTDASQDAGITVSGHNGFGVAFTDLDNDGWLDLYVANDLMPNLVFQNNGDSTFREAGLVSGAALSRGGREQAGMGVGVGDYDRNGFLDIFVTNFSRDTNTLYQNLGGFLFVDVSAAALGTASLEHLGWGTGLADLDNDGWLDIFVSNGHVYPEIDTVDTDGTYRQPKEIYRNAGQGVFEEITRQVGGDVLIPKSTRGTAFGDYDNDGDLDVFAVNMNEAPSLYRNDGGSRSHWITFRLEGTRGNRDAIGARVEIRVGESSRVGEVASGGSYLSHNDMRLHFGLGEATRIDSVRVRWPSGDIEELGPVPADRFVTVREGSGYVSPE